MIDHEKRTGRACDGSFRHDIRAEQLTRLAKYGLVVDRLYIDVACQAHGPRTVVVSSEARIGIGLLFEKSLRKPPVRLIELHEIRTGCENAVFDFEFSGRPLHLDTLPPDEVHDARDLSLIGLARRNNKTVRRFCFSFRDGMQALLVEILHDECREFGR